MESSSATLSEAEEDDDDIEEDETTLDQLTPDYVIYQLRRGHRFSNDDRLCAWRAAEHASRLVRERASSATPRAPLRVLDLGSGIGSVGLTVLWRLPSEATLVMVEAQATSVKLARRTILRNGLSKRVKVVRRDLREFPPEIAPERDHTSNKGEDDQYVFDVITGSPPYVPASAGVVSAHSQKAHCRFELRGGLDDYCQAAARCLAPDGVFVFVMAAADPRCDSAPTRAGFQIIERFEYKFKGDRAASHVATVACKRRGFFSSGAAASDETSGSKKADAVVPEEEESSAASLGRTVTTLVLRDADGRRTLDYRAWQEYMWLRPGAATFETLRDALRDLRDALEAHRSFLSHETVETHMALACGNNIGGGAGQYTTDVDKGNGAPSSSSSSSQTPAGEERKEDSSTTSRAKTQSTPTPPRSPSTRGAAAERLLEAAVARAEALGMRPTKGSDELREAKLALLVGHRLRRDDRDLVDESRASAMLVTTPPAADAVAEHVGESVDEEDAAPEEDAGRGLLGGVFWCPPGGQCGWCF